MDKGFENGIIFMIIRYVFFGFIIFLVIKEYLRKKELRKLKIEGKGILKDSEITNIVRKYHSGDRDSSGYYTYQIVSMDTEGNSYKSDRFTASDYGERTKEDMQVIFGDKQFDLTNKDVAIKQLNDELLYIEGEFNSDPNFFKKIKLKKDKKYLEYCIEVAQEGIIPTYVILNKHRIKVGDPINIYVNPNNLNEYYFDLDFAK